MEQIINYRDIPTDKRIDILKDVYKRQGLYRPSAYPSFQGLERGIAAPGRNHRREVFARSGLRLERAAAGRSILLIFLHSLKALLYMLVKAAGIFKDSKDKL